MQSFSCVITQLSSSKNGCEGDWLTMETSLIRETTQRDERLHGKLLGTRIIRNYMVKPTVLNVK